MRSSRQVCMTTIQLGLHSKGFDKYFFKKSSDIFDGKRWVDKPVAKEGRLSW